MKHIEIIQTKDSSQYILATLQKVLVFKGLLLNQNIYSLLKIGLLPEL